MTATPVAAPKPPVQLATGDVEFVGTLLGLHHEGIVNLPTGLVDRIRAADSLERTRRAVAEDVIAQDPSTTRRGVLDALKEAAAAGTLPEDAGAAAAEHQRDLAAAQLRYEVLTEAATEAANEVRADVVNGADDLGELFRAALARLLAEAEEPARVMRAEPIAWGDPAGLYAADKAVQGAYGRLEPLSRLHDRVRRAAVALSRQARDWQLGDPEQVFAARQRLGGGQDPEWRRAGALAGYGVEQAPGGLGRDAGWHFNPSGHPVQRLVAAATDPAPEPLTEPALAEA